VSFVKQHRFDPLSFLFGAVFLAVGMTCLFAGEFPQIRPSQIWPAAMIVASSIRSVIEGSSSAGPTSSRMCLYG
jgi:hypothetical protein